ncbi:MAG: ATP-grasp domain-containing protein [Bacteroidales bacterium]|nr:ATP-grasp domain-containing protein [Bacteroidales bacterium]
MIINKKSILVFGGSDFQRSLIKECMKMGLFTIVIDPNPNAEAKDYAHAFEVVGGQDFERTCKVVEKYNIDAIITGATDKPLIMMARIAEKYGLNFISEETARLSTDKFLMKQKFQENNLPHAKGILIEEINDNLQYPLIIKPSDNSGSRGVIFCENKQDLETIFDEAKTHTKKSYLIAEEFIEGKEYSIESIHYNGMSKILQITEKIVTPLPYFIELGHIQPADIEPKTLKSLEELLDKATKAFGFESCGAHNEVKMNNGNITLIEVSPRIGGDFISSTLVKSSTGINMEKALIQMALGEEPQLEVYKPAVSGIFFFFFKEGKIKSLNNIESILNIPEVIQYEFRLKQGDIIPKIKTGVDRYGYFILKTENKNKLVEVKNKIFDSIKIEIE